MKTKQLMKLFILSVTISFGLSIAIISSNIYAGSSCGPHHYKRHHHYSRYGVSIYYVCPCARVWVPGHCGRCGHWVRGHYVYVSGVYYAQPAYYVDYGYHEDRGYDPDLSTGDDNAMVDPNMDIDH